MRILPSSTASDFSNATKAEEISLIALPILPLNFRSGVDFVDHGMSPGDATSHPFDVPEKMWYHISNDF